MNMMSAFEVRPKDIIRVNDYWMVIFETQTNVGAGVAETRLRGREFNTSDAVELTVPCRWRFENATEQEILDRMMNAPDGPAHTPKEPT